MIASAVTTAGLVLEQPAVSAGEGETARSQSITASLRAVEPGQPQPEPLEPFAGAVAAAITQPA